MILTCKNISKSFGITEILKNVSFIIEDNEKIGLVGVNGAGKSTLFNIISGRLKADHGDIITGSSIKVGYLTQNMELNTTNTVYEEALEVFDYIIQLEKEIR